jgi:hypothetical protein
MRRSPALAFALLCAASAEAGPRDYAFTWDSQTLEKGKAQAFFEVTPRTGRKDYYSRFDSNGGAVLGLTNELEAYLELDTWFDFSGQPPEIRGQGRATTYWRYHFLQRGEPLGFAAQLKVSVSFDDLALGGRFIVDYRSSSIRLAFNAAFERTIFFRANTGVTMRAEEALALGYALKNSLTPALELVVQQSMTDDKFMGSAFFVGGSLTHKPKWGWFSLGMLVQVAAAKAAADVGNGERLEVNDHERFLFRFGIGLNSI